jgi:hypothetical protein
MFLIIVMLNAVKHLVLIVSGEILRGVYPESFGRLRTGSIEGIRMTMVWTPPEFCVS